MRSTILLLLLCLFCSGCAARKLPRANLAAGQLGHAVLKDCRLRGATVVCACATFDLSLDAKTGGSVLRCPQAGK